MPAQDTSLLKDKILSLLRIRGPGLPVHVARETNLSILFSSAFLSELLSEKKIKTSHMKVGGSPLYFIPGQEPRLENFSQHLKSKEKDAFNLLKEKKFLRDKEQEPAIRVALRSIRDFAIPFRINEEIIWRYFTIPESEFRADEFKTIPMIIAKQEPLVKVTIDEQKTSESQLAGQEKIEPDKKERGLDIFDKKIKPEKKEKKKLKSKPKTDEKFFIKLKDFLVKNSIEIINIENFKKNELIVRVRENQEEKILFAFNKKKISDMDIIKAYRKSLKSDKYSILCLGEPPKKLNELIESLKNLSEIKKLE